MTAAWKRGAYALLSRRGPRWILNAEADEAMRAAPAARFIQSDHGKIKTRCYSSRYGCRHAVIAVVITPPR